jgi:hypothetical protein
MMMIRNDGKRPVPTRRRSWRRGLAAGCAFALLLAAAPVAGWAADMPVFDLVMQNHQFEPATLKVPADTKFKVRVINKNPVPAEFESAEFNREKIVLPGRTVTVFIGPLKAGEYHFFDDFHQETKGVLVVE